MTSATGLYAEQLQRQKEEEERHHLEEMSEDEYDALSEEQKAAVDQQRLEIKKRRLQRSAVHSRVMYIVYIYFCYSFTIVHVVIICLMSVLKV